MEFPNRKRSKSPDSDDSMHSSPGALTSYGGTPPLSTMPMGNLVTRSYESMAREMQPIDERYHGAIVVHNYYSATQASSLAAGVDCLVLQHQQGPPACNGLFVGLNQLKTWARNNIQRVLVPSANAVMQRISEQLAPTSVCTINCAPGSGVRSYLEELCKELRVNLYVVGSMVFEPPMMKDLVAEAERAGRSLILLDQTHWFSSVWYETRGVFLIQQLHARIATRMAARSREMLASSGGAAAFALRNDMLVPTLGSALPGLWIVVTTPTTDIHADLLQMSNGFCIINDCSRDIAFNAVKGALQRMLNGIFDPVDFETTVSQTAYLHQLNAIADALATCTVGQIIKVVNVARQTIYARNQDRDPALVDLLPTALDIQQALAQLQGTATMVAHAETQTQAHAVAAYANAHAYSRRT